MGVKVEIYTKKYCAYCQRAKELLSIKGMEFIEHDITNDRLKAEEMLQRGQLKVVPGIFIDNILIGGCTELFSLDEQGALDALLGMTPGTRFPA